MKYHVVAFDILYVYIKNSPRLEILSASNLFKLKRILIVFSLAIL